MIRVIISNCCTQWTTRLRDNMLLSLEEEHKKKIKALMKIIIPFYLHFKVYIAKKDTAPPSISLLPTTSPSYPLIHLQHYPTRPRAPHPVSKLGHASQPTAHTFLSSSSFWTLIHLWSDSVQFALQGIQDYCTYWAVASRSTGWVGVRGVWCVRGSPKRGG